jgi:hypothetical protein
MFSLVVFPIGAYNLLKTFVLKPLKKVTKQSVSRRDAALKELLRELADIFLRFGITPKLFGELAKEAFVESAASTSIFRNGAINHSRVAVITGLSRLEVRRLLAGRTSRFLKTKELSRAERVLSGWTSDRNLRDARGRPRCLPLKGSESFASVVRQYGGDVPARAVLKELRHKGLVKEIKGEVHLDDKRDALLNRANVKAFAMTRRLLKVLREDLSTEA